MFEGDSADTCTEKFPLVSMGAERRVKRAQTLERGPPSAPAELFYLINHMLKIYIALSLDNLLHLIFTFSIINGVAKKIPF